MSDIYTTIYFFISKVFLLVALTAPVTYVHEFSVKHFLVFVSPEVDLSNEMDFVFFYFHNKRVNFTLLTAANNPFRKSVTFVLKVSRLRFALDP